MDLKNIHEIADHKIRGENVITFPLKHAAAGGIWDANGCHILDIRGWGRLQYDTENGSQLHDAIAEWVVKTLNEAYESTPRS